jgi:hypothetical protein
MEHLVARPVPSARLRHTRNLPSELKRKSALRPSGQKGVAQQVDFGGLSTLFRLDRDRPMGKTEQCRFEFKRPQRLDIEKAVVRVGRSLPMKHSLTHDRFGDRGDPC